MTKQYKDYTKEEIRKIIAKRYNTSPINVYQLDSDYDDEYRIKSDDYQEITDRKHIEVVSVKTAIRNEEDFCENRNEWLWSVIETLLNEEELVQIGAYNKLAEDLFYREF